MSNKEFNLGIWGLALLFIGFFNLFINTDLMVISAKFSLFVYVMLGLGGFIFGRFIGKITQH